MSNLKELIGCPGDRCKKGISASLFVDLHLNNKRMKILTVFGTRPEAVDAGTVKLVGTGVEAIVTVLTSLLSNEEAYKALSFSHNPYGDGKACQRICDELASNKL